MGDEELRQVVLYIAMSLDGYIADGEGNVAWISGQDDSVENKDTYSDFFKNVDTILMGWNTYHQVTAVLSPAEWVYAGHNTFVFTHRALADQGEIHFTDEPPEKLVERLKSMEGRNIWVCGGAEIVRQLMENHLIDRFHIAIIPMLLGSGIRLFPEQKGGTELRLVESTQYNGICELIYERREIGIQ